MLIIIASTLKQTLSACPSQWECGLTTDGRKVYIRYRWGILTVRIENGSDIRIIKDEEGWDGMMTTDELLEFLPKNADVRFV